MECQRAHIFLNPIFRVRLRRLDRICRFRRIRRAVCGVGTGHPPYFTRLTPPPTMAFASRLERLFTRFGAGYRAVKFIVLQPIVFSGISRAERGPHFKHGAYSIFLAGRRSKSFGLLAFSSALLLCSLFAPPAKAAIATRKTRTVVVATYPGDSNFTSSASDILTVQAVVPPPPPPTFTLTANPSTLSHSCWNDRYSDAQRDTAGRIQQSGNVQLLGPACKQLVRFPALIGYTKWLYCDYGAHDVQIAANEIPAKGQRGKVISFAR